MTKPQKRRARRLISIQMNLDEINSLPPLLRSRVIDRAARKSMAEAKGEVIRNSDGVPVARWIKD